MNAKRPADRRRWSVPAFLLIVIPAATVFRAARTSRRFRAHRKPRVPGLIRGPGENPLAAGRSRRTRGRRSRTSKATGCRVIPKTVMSKQAESSPFRFAEIAKEAGIDFVHFSGHDRRQALSDGQRLGRRRLRLRRRRAARHLLRHLHALPAGTAEKGPNRLYKNLGGNRSRT